MSIMFYILDSLGIVPDGTYEVCSRTTGQAAAGKIKEASVLAEFYNVVLIFFFKSTLITTNKYFFLVCAILSHCLH